MIKVTNIYAMAVVLVATPVFHCQAQTPPDAGELLRDIERKLPQPVPDSKAVIDQPLPREMVDAGGVSVTLNHINFAGNHLLDDNQLDEVVQTWLGRSLAYKDLQAATAAVAERYRQAGWVVRTYLPRQEIIDGVLTIQVVEAAFGQTRFAGDTARLPVARIEHLVENVQQVATPINTHDLERAVLLVDDLPGVRSRAALAAGEQETETDLILTFEEAARLRSRIELDNAGSRSTGEERLIGSFILDNPSGSGDQGALTALKTPENTYGKLEYSLPVGYDGLRLGASLSYMAYDLAGDFSSLDADGKAQTTGLFVSYPLIRSRYTNLFLSGSYSLKTFENSSLGVTTSDYSSDVLMVAALASHYDGFYGGGMTTAELTVSQGSLDLDGSPNQSADAVTVNTDGDFTLMNFSINRLQTITPTSAFYASLSTQFTSHNLDSSEHYSLGGPRAVRAYPVNEGGGDEGHLLSLEWRKQLDAMMRLDVFYDHGWIKLNRDNNYAGAPADNSYELKGAGLGFNWKPMSVLDVNASWSHRIGSNPGALVSGKDQDGSLFKNRFWVSFAYGFEV